MEKDHLNKLTNEEVEHIAALARLGITEKEKERFRRELSAILVYIEELNQLNTEEILPMTGGTELINILRSDEPRKIDSISESLLIEQAPESKNGFFKAPRILE